MISLSDIKSKAPDFLQQVISIREHLHKHPELSFKEFNTSKYIQEILRENNIPFQSIANTGLVAHIGPKTGEALCLRAELDALPIKEESSQKYTSLHQGIMHACGHDVHMASLLGTTFLLKYFEDKIERPIKILFQPGEEKLPGGAKKVLEEGVLKTHNITRMMAQHVAPKLEVGTIGFKAGLYMASCDELYIKVVGKGGHAALKDSYLNPLIISSELLLKLEELINNNKTLSTPSVLSFGKIQSDGGATNVIPNTVFLEGTFRTFDEKFRAQTHQEIKIIIEDLNKKWGSNIDLNIKKGYPFLNNDAHLVSEAKKHAIEYLDKEAIVDLDLRMTSEDFAYFSHKVPVCFYRLGVRNEKKGITSMVHTPTFDIDQEAFNHSFGLMAYLAVSL